MHDISANPCLIRYLYRSKKQNGDYFCLVVAACVNDQPILFLFFESLRFLQHNVKQPCALAYQVTGHGNGSSQANVGQVFFSLFMKEQQTRQTLQQGVSNQIGISKSNGYDVKR